MRKKLWASGLFVPICLPYDVAFQVSTPFPDKTACCLGSSKGSHSKNMLMKKAHSLNADICFNHALHATEVSFDFSELQPLAL